jgi:MFS family permease
VTTKGVLGQMWELAKDRRFMHLIPQFVWTGISIAYYSGLLVLMMQKAIGGDDKQYQFKMSMLAMVMLGVGEVTGCFFIGLIVDRFGSKTAILCNIVLITLMMSSTIAFIIIFEFNWIVWLMCFLWGFTDSAVNTNTQEMIGFEFDNNCEPFSVANIFQSIGNFSFQIIISFLKTPTHYLYFSIFVFVFAVVSCGITYFFPFRELKSSKLGNPHSFYSIVVEEPSLA